MMRTGRRIPCALAALALAMTTPALVSAAETKSYVASWLHVATYAQDDDCPQGTNPSARQLYTRILHDLGITDPAEVKSILTGIPDDGGTDKRGRRAREIGQMRGRIDGKEVNVYAFPYSVPDPHIHLAEGRYANGFNLDGKSPPPGRRNSNRSMPRAISVLRATCSVIVSAAEDASAILSIQCNRSTRPGSCARRVHRTMQCLLSSRQPPCQSYKLSS